MSRAVHQTQLITSGFIRNAESLLPTGNNPYHTIPSDIKTIVSLYIDNYFENKGTHQWIIDDPKLVEQMLNAESGQSFTSNIFEMARLKWKLQIYPNGNKSITNKNVDLTGYFIIHLKLLSLPSNIDTITFSRMFRVLENSTGNAWIETISKGEHDFWTQKCPLIELKDLKCNTLTIQVQVNIFSITLKEHISNISNNNNNSMVTDSCNIPMKQHLEIRLNKQEINILINPKYSEFYKAMCSEISHDMWCIEVYRATGTEHVEVDLKLIGFPDIICGFNAKFELVCKELDRRNIPSIYKFNMQYKCRAEFDFVSFEEISKLDFVTFTMDVEITKVKFRNDNNAQRVSDEMKIAYFLSAET